MAELLLDGGCDVNAKEAGETALHKAAENGHELTVKLLLDRGVHTQTKPWDVSPALHRAAGNGHASTVKLLVDNRADVNTAALGETALHWAARNGHISTARQLLDYGANINAENSENDMTPPATPCCRERARAYGRPTTQRWRQHQ